MTDNIAYESFGQGSPILLISGSGNVMDVWPSSMLHELSSNHTIIIFDNRGVGNTTLGTKPISVKQMANDTVGLLDALKIHKVDVLGFSMGSFVAEQLAITHPERESIDSYYMVRHVEGKKACLRVLRLPKLYQISYITVRMM